MCVIIIKPRGARMPSREILNACYAANHDGCGFYSEHDYYRTLNYDRFLKRLDRVADNELCIIHFRLATHGSIRRSNCHPFIKKGICFAHNGILDVEPMQDKTDSETAFLRCFLQSAYKCGIHSRELAQDISKVRDSSRFVFADGGDFVTFGDFTKVGHLLFSNMRWRCFTRDYHVSC